ncbi:hypothetical protein G6F62_014600 [Rhizopus arrhizus]|nr:hypothetical protein G6F23_014574 [Rhizopus arrhizus]KAG1310540.1 hypothetical protein G6F62_014600 [Rhizopus arrhizus]
MGTTSLLSFFFPPLRATANIHLGSFLPTMYEAMDSFLKKGCSDVQCNPSTLLSLPLLALFSDIPSGHWLLSHNRSKSLSAIPQTIWSSGAGFAKPNCHSQQHDMEFNFERLP